MLRRMMPFRIVGGLVAVIGLVLAAAPTLVSDPGPAADTYEAIERRVWYGAIAGVGALVVARTRLRPWRDTLAHVVLWLVGGFLTARCIGLVLDGTDSGMQWVWVGVEGALVIAAAVYLARRRAT
jgi:hypothetical protein